MKKTLLLIPIISLLLTVGCVKKSEPTSVKSEPTSTIPLGSEALLADTIIYPVTIFNYDPQDDWAEHRLHKVQRTKFVEEIFDAIYAGKLDVYHYYTGELLSIEDIKNLEKMPDFSRDRIEEIQFDETWHFSLSSKQFQKEVHSIVLAYALYTDEGERRGLKAAFRIKLND
jgi:hypothetical protein